MFVFFNCIFKKQLQKKSYRHCFCIVPNTTWFLPPNVWVFTFLKLFFFFCSLLISGLTFKCFKVFIVSLFYPPPFPALCVEPTWTGPTLSGRVGLLGCKAFVPGTHYSSHSQNTTTSMCQTVLWFLFLLFIFLGWTFELWLPTCVTFLSPLPTNPWF